MPKVFVQADTILKKRLLGSEDLTDAEKLSLPKGKEFYVSEVAPDRNQHLLLKLASPMLANDQKTRLQTVYAYSPHVALAGEGVRQVIKLHVDYCSQLDIDILPVVNERGFLRLTT